MRAQANLGSFVRAEELRDANPDGIVSFPDFLALSASLGSGTVDNPASWSDGDFDGNGEVGFEDFQMPSEYY